MLFRSAPTDTANHRYIVYVRTDRAYWYVDALTTPVATSSFQSPSVQTLPVKYLAVSGGSATTIQSPGIAVWDTGKNASQIADGTYPWRKATVTAAGHQIIRQNSPTATLSNVASSATNVTLLALNLNRTGATVANDSNQVLYLKLGATASTTSYTVKMRSSDYYEVPFGYTGQIDGIWASANGNARITELV